MRGRRIVFSEGLPYTGKYQRGKRRSRLFIPPAIIFLSCVAKERKKNEPMIFLPFARSRSYWFRSRYWISHKARNYALTTNLKKLVFRLALTNWIFTFNLQKMRKYHTPKHSSHRLCRWCHCAFATNLKKLYFRLVLPWIISLRLT